MAAVGLVKATASPPFLQAAEPGVNQMKIMRYQGILTEILTKAADLPWDHHLYLQEGCHISEDTHALVLNDDEEFERDAYDEPLYATEHGMKYCITIQALQDIISNLQQQVSNPTDKALLAAFKHYVENDAFIEIAG